MDRLYGRWVEWGRKRPIISAVIIGTLAAITAFIIATVFGDDSAVSKSPVEPGWV
jgi:hypothetical protein